MPKCLAWLVNLFVCSCSAATCSILAIAEAQQGYFTVAQAGEAGYLPGSRAHHVKAGNWVRAERGVYRLQRYL